jgi:hypothetical protein
MAFSAWCRLHAWTACVSNIEQLPRVCSVIFLWDGGDKGLRSRLYKQKTGADMPSLLSIFYRAKHHKISEQPLDSEILGNLDKTSKHFIVKWVVHQYEALPVEVENDIPQDLDELVSSRQERFVGMRLKYPNTPPDGFLIFDSDGIEVLRVCPPQTVTVRCGGHPARR